MPKVPLPRLNTPMARAFLDHNDAKRQKKRREETARANHSNFTPEFALPEFD